MFQALLVCRALSVQWRSVGAVAPERVVASFLCSRFVSCTCALLDNGPEVADACILFGVFWCRLVCHE